MISPSLRERVEQKIAEWRHHVLVAGQASVEERDRSLAELAEAEASCYRQCADELAALLDAIPASGQEPENTWFGWHLERGHTLTHRERYYECSCGATLWHEAKKSDERQVNWGGDDTVLLVNVFREDDGRYAAEWRRDENREGGMGEYSATPIGALANLCATLIQVDEDNSIDRRQAAADSPTQE